MYNRAQNTERTAPRPPRYFAGGRLLRPLIMAAKLPDNPPPVSARRRAWIVVFTAIGLATPTQYRSHQRSGMVHCRGVHRAGELSETTWPSALMPLLGRDRDAFADRKGQHSRRHNRCKDTSGVDVVVVGGEAPRVAIIDADKHNRRCRAAPLFWRARCALAANVACP